jgi:PPM family protein phosphatase
MDERMEVRLSPVAAIGSAKGARATQQDAAVSLHDDISGTHLLVLADGMGGHGAGELASRLVVETAERFWHEGGWKQEPGAVFLERLCQQSHLHLREVHDVTNGITPHSTIVCLLINPHISYWAHVGDSRLYRYQGAQFLGHTKDHSLTQDKIRRGAALEGAFDGREQHLLLQGLGGNTSPVVEHGCMPTRSDHLFVLCSDGVWAHVSSEELGALSRRDDGEAMVTEALTLALKRGGDEADNASLIFVKPPREKRFKRWKAWLGRHR